MIVIVDDQRAIWGGFQNLVIEIQPFVFFKSEDLASSPNFQQLRLRLLPSASNQVCQVKPESESKGLETLDRNDIYLMFLSEHLDKVHYLFF